MSFSYPPKSEKDLDEVIAFLDSVIAVDDTTRIAKQCGSIKERVEEMRSKMKETP